MKTTKKQLHVVLQNYIANKNLTVLCRELKRFGIVKRVEISKLFHEHYSHRYLRSKGINVACLIWNDLSCDLDKKEKEYTYELPYNMLQAAIRNKQSGNYKKILIEGNTHIYWAHPYYQHQDYNKSIWRKNTPENRAKMQIINNFLNK